MAISTIPWGTMGQPRAACTGGPIRAMRGSVNNREPQLREGASAPLLGLSGWSFTWNDENRLVVAETPTNVGGASRRRLEFQYDHQGRRRTKKVYTWDDPTQSWVLSETHTYLYDQWNVVCERVTDASTQTTTHSIYAWGLDLSNFLQGAGGVGGLLAAHSPDGNWFYAYDGNGNITTLVSTSDGSIQAQYDYSPFGLTVSQSGVAADENVYRFSTKAIDQSGLYYYGRRYYTPDTGRWLSRDPIGEMDHRNLYCFCHGEPIGGIDLLGLAFFSSCKDECSKGEYEWTHDETVIMHGNPNVLNSPLAWTLLLAAANNLVPVPTSAADWTSWAVNYAVTHGFPNPSSAVLISLSGI